MKRVLDRDLFHLLFDSAPIAITNTSFDGKMLNVNKKYCELVGYSEQELTEMTFLDFTHPDDKTRDAGSLKELFSGQVSSKRFEKRYIHKSGKVIWAELNISLIYDDSGKPLATFSTMVDISERKQMQESLAESERRFRTLFEQAPFSFQLISKDGRTLKVSDAWRELWGISDEFVQNFILKKYNILKDPQLKAKGITEYLQRGIDGEIVRIPPAIYDPGEQGNPGRARVVEAYVYPIKDLQGDVREIVLVHRDITEHERTLAELREAKEAAESANRMKSSFIANVTHEIRTPLSAILGFMELATDPNTDQAKRDEYFRVMRKSAEGLTQIINDVLDLSKVEADRLTLEYIALDPRDAVNEVLSILQIAATERKNILTLSISNNVPQSIMTDPTRVRQVLINLIGNAIKFTRNGEITIKLSMVENNLEVTVSDTGIGIPHEQQRDLFQPFFQSDESHTRQYGGTGLGLALCRRLASALGGDVSLVRSEVGKGSVFKFSVPIKIAPKEASPSEQILHAIDSARPLEGRTILLAEDSVDIQFLIKTSLEMAGARVWTADNGAAAIAQTTQKTFDLILMDVQMPVMDGLTATRDLRKNGYTKPIVALTAHALGDERQIAMEAGCSDYITKPVQRNDLIQKILSVLAD